MYSGFSSNYSSAFSSACSSATQSPSKVPQDSSGLTTVRRSPRDFCKLIIHHGNDTEARDKMMEFLNTYPRPYFIYPNDTNNQDTLTVEFDSKRIAEEVRETFKKFYTFIEMELMEDVLKDYKNVYVVNLPNEDFSEETLQALFVQYGPIHSFKLIRKPNRLSTGFVRFQRYEDARNAVQTINSQNLLNGMARIQCKFANKTIRQSKVDNANINMDSRCTSECSSVNSSRCPTPNSSSFSSNNIHGQTFVFLPFYNQSPDLSNIHPSQTLNQTQPCYNICPTQPQQQQQGANFINDNIGKLKIRGSDRIYYPPNNAQDTCHAPVLSNNSPINTNQKCVIGPAQAPSPLINVGYQSTSLPVMGLLPQNQQLACFQTTNQV